MSESKDWALNLPYREFIALISITFVGSPQILERAMDQKAKRYTGIKFWEEQEY